MIEKQGTQLSDVIGNIITLMLHLYSGYNYKIVVCQRVYAFVYERVLRLIAKGIIRSYSMQRRGHIVNPNGMKKIFDWILHELQYLDKVHARHFTLDLDQLDRIFEYRITSNYRHSAY